MSIGTTYLALSVLVSSAPAAENAGSPATLSVDQRRPQLGSLGWAGVGTLAAGFPVAALGVAFIPLNAHSAPDHPTKIRNFRPSGIALATSGAALMLTGAILIALDRRKAARRQLSFSPGFGEGQLGLSVTGRF